MKKMRFAALAIFVMMIFVAGCDNASSSTTQEATQQENIQQQSNNVVGMPAITHFTEKRLLKQIQELRDQANLATYTYIVAENTGKLIFIGDSIGYGIPASTEYDNPMKTVEGNTQGELTAIPQADPNGLYSPSSSDGTWVMLIDPKTGKAVPTYIEPRVIVSQFPLPTNQ